MIALKTVDVLTLVLENYSCRERHSGVSFPNVLMQLRCSSRLGLLCHLYILGAITFVFPDKLATYSEAKSVAVRLVFPMMAAASPRRVIFIATCSYPTDICKDIMKSQVHVSKDFCYSDTARLP
ncbi:hypothetical protein Tco_1212178 [Tanacetum coccineum]